MGLFLVMELWRKLSFFVLKYLPTSLHWAYTGGKKDAIVVENPIENKYISPYITFSKRIYDMTHFANTLNYVLLEPDRIFSEVQVWLRMIPGPWRLQAFFLFHSVQKHVNMRNGCASISRNDLWFIIQVNNFPAAHQSPDSACPIYLFHLHIVENSTVLSLPSLSLFLLTQQCQK